MKIRSVLLLIKHFVKTYKFALLSAFLILLSVFIILIIPDKMQHEHDKKGSKRIIIDCDRTRYATAPIESQRILNDKNDIQNLHAQINGLKQIYISNASFEADSAAQVKNHVLVHLKNNRYYHIKEMTHSYPYATPEMADLLNEIGTRFYEKLKDKNIGYYRFLVTSALRTNETQQELLGRNRNASTQSAHLFGATIDITYKEFYNVKANSLEQNWQVGDVLRTVMLDLREECRLLVVRERRQAVYHFTVVNCDPAKSPANEISRKVFEY